MRTTQTNSAWLLTLVWLAACSIHERDLGDASANARSRAGAAGVFMSGDTRPSVGAGGVSKSLDGSQSTSTHREGGGGESSTGSSWCGAACGTFSAGAPAVGGWTGGSGTPTGTTAMGGNSSIEAASGANGLGSAGVTIEGGTGFGTFGGTTSGGVSSGGNTNGGTPSGGVSSGGVSSGGVSSGANTNGGTPSGGASSGGTSPASSAFSGCTIAQQNFPKAHVNVDNPCEVCDPTRSTTQWTPLEEGTSCGAARGGKICHERACQVGCWIQGTYRSSGESRSASEPCKSCQPQLSVSDWSNTPDGTRCESGGGKFCSTGVCKSGCFIEGAYRASGATDPTSSCRSCAVTNDQAWTRGPSCVTSTVTGNDHTCALLDAAKLKCWGNNASGQLGNDSITPSRIPVEPALASASLGRIKAVATGHEHTCVVLESGSVWCWGSNSKGQLGPDAAAMERRPVQPFVFTNAQAIAAGLEHTCVIRLGGAVECWGSNAYGQVGKNPASNEPVPTPYQVISGARNVVAGANHTCAILEDNTVRCWGNGTKGQLGDGFGVDRPNPVNPSISSVSILGAGYAHTCVVRSGGSVQCWGYNGFGQLGIDAELPFEDKVTATPVQKLAAAAAHVATGTGHTCVALVNGKVQCFGRDTFWQLGDDAAYADRGEPVSVVNLTQAVQVAAGRDHSCATLSNGAVRCWGRNNYGQLGNNGSEDSFEPVSVVGL